MDTDRLPEEKRRGISIELGYAYSALADDEPLAFIDVPGHERLVHTMVAGVGGVDFALLVVAADDGVMPQTREHVTILEQREYASVLQQILDGGEVSEPFGAASPPRRRAWVDDDAPSDSAACLGIAYDKGIAGSGTKWGFKNELCACAASRLEAAGVEQHRVCDTIGGT